MNVYHVVRFGYKMMKNNLHEIKLKIIMSLAGVAEKDLLSMYYSRGFRMISIRITEDNIIVDAKVRRMGDVDPHSGELWIGLLDWSYGKSLEEIKTSMKHMLLKYRLSDKIQEEYLERSRNENHN